VISSCAQSCVFRALGGACGGGDFITGFGGTALALPLSARAQQREPMRRIGILLPAAADDAEFQVWVGAFLQALG
jgi:hypothetical protein